ncbi:hypothetical protein SNEBB_009262 [Seison nebaliae]|nr:hypothetical protein SNEBB_009262 [Seison nebaliae]
MRGLTPRSLMSNYFLIPLFSCVVFSSTIAFINSFHELKSSPDVKVNRRKEMDPWRGMENSDGSFKQYKWYVPNTDYKTYVLDEDRPKL